MVVYLGYIRVPTLVVMAWAGVTFMVFCQPATFAADTRVSDARALAAHGDWTRAVIEVLQVSKDELKSPTQATLEVFQERTRIETAAGRWSTSPATFELLMWVAAQLKNDPALHQAWFDLARVYGFLGREKDQQEYVAKLKAIDYPKTDALPVYLLYSKACDQANQRDFAAATQTCDAILKKSVDEDLVLATLYTRAGAVYGNDKSRDKRSSLTAFADIRRRWPNSYWAYKAAIRMGEINTQLAWDYLHDSLMAYEMALPVDTQSCEAQTLRMQVVAIYRLQHRYGDAEKLLKGTAALRSGTPGAAQCWKALGDIYCEEGKKKEAVEAWERAVKESNDRREQVATYLALTDFYMQEDDLTRARQAFLRADATMYLVTSNVDPSLRITIEKRRAELQARAAWQEAKAKR